MPAGGGSMVPAPGGQMGVGGVASPVMRAPQVGDIVISELMTSATGFERGDWIELYNASVDARSLDGCVVTALVDNVPRVLPSAAALDGIQIEPGEYILLARSRDALETGLPADIQPRALFDFDLVMLRIRFN